MCYYIIVLGEYGGAVGTAIVVHEAVVEESDRWVLWMLKFIGRQDSAVGAAVGGA